MEDRETFHQADGEGNIQEICVTTGEIVSDIVKVPVKSAWVYSEVIADVICQKIASGGTLTRICKMQGFPSIGVIKRWKAEQETFAQALAYAEEARAERFHDRIVEDLDEVKELDKDSVPARKLYTDNLKYLAKVNDRKKYGERDQKVAGGTGDVIIQLNTGIDRGITEIPNNVIEVVEKQKRNEE